MIRPRWWLPPLQGLPACDDTARVLAADDPATPRSVAPLVLRAAVPSVPTSPRSRVIDSGTAGPRRVGPSMALRTADLVGREPYVVLGGDLGVRVCFRLEYRDLLGLFPRNVLAAIQLYAEDDPELSHWLELVGIEPNPGPKGKKAIVAAPKKKTKGTTKKVVEIVKVQKPAVKPAGSVGRNIGSSIGGWVGDLAQKAIMAITGFGDYTVRTNSLVNGGSPPQFAMGKHCTKVCHREFVGLISSAGSAFTLSSYPLNPTSGLFPWLSEIALSFEQFVVRGMVVEFKSTSATAVASTNTALGSVILATQYNVLAPAFVNQQQMEAYEFCTSCAPSVSMIHPIECAPGANSVSELFVDQPSITGSFPGAGDPRLSNLGTVYIATVGQQAASVVGELWVSYEIDLIRPKLFSGIQNLGLTYRASAAGFAQSGSSLSTDPFDVISKIQNNQSTGATGLVTGGGSDLPIRFGSANSSSGMPSGTFSLPGWLAGNVFILCFYQFAAFAGSTPYQFTTSGAVNPSCTSGAGSILISWASNASVSVEDQLALTSSSVTSNASGTSPTVVCGLTVNLTGNNPSVPVVFSWFPFTSATSALSCTGFDVLATTIATTF